MMRARDVKLAVLAVACTAVVGLAANYVWVDAGNGHDWDTCQNWIMLGSGEECYPSTTEDDATIPYTQGGWTVSLVDDELIDRIDDFLIAGSVEFDPADPNDPNGVTLVVDSLTISGGESEDTVVVLDAATSIVVAAPE